MPSGQLSPRPLAVEKSAEAYDSGSSIPCPHGIRRSASTMSFSPFGAPTIVPIAPGGKEPMTGQPPELSGTE